jgi:hypothetical protein
MIAADEVLLYLAVDEKYVVTEANHRGGPADFGIKQMEIF